MSRRFMRAARGRRRTRRQRKGRAGRDRVDGGGGFARQRLVQTVLATALALAGMIPRGFQWTQRRPTPERLQVEAPRRRIVRAGMAVVVIATVILGEAHTQTFGVREELEAADKARVSNERL